MSSSAGSPRGELGDESGGVRRQRTGAGSSDVLTIVPSDAVSVLDGTTSGRYDG